MKLGQRVKRVDSSGELASKPSCFHIVFLKRSSSVVSNLRSRINFQIKLAASKVKVFVESDNEETEYTSNHVIIAGRTNSHICVCISIWWEDLHICICI